MEREIIKYWGSDDGENLCLKQGVAVVADTPKEQAELRRAAQRIDVPVEELDYYGKRICVKLTSTDLDMFNEALNNLQPTEQESQSSRVRSKFFGLINS